LPTAWRWRAVTVILLGALVFRGVAGDDPLWLIAMSALLAVLLVW